MQEIIHAFGIDGRLIIIQIVNFGILIGVLWYFLYTPVLKMLAEREAKIKKGVADAVLAERALQDADAEKTNILKAARTEATVIVNRGTAHAEEKGKALLQEAEDKVSRELAQAKLAADELKHRAIKESEAEIAKLAIIATEKLLSQKLG